jgi:hypothetical protein
MLFVKNDKPQYEQAILINSQFHQLPLLFYKFSIKNLFLLPLIKEVAVPGLENRDLTAVGIRCADHVTPSIRKSWH